MPGGVCASRGKPDNWETGACQSMWEQGEGGFILELHRGRDENGTHSNLLFLTLPYWQTKQKQNPKSLITSRCIEIDTQITDKHENTYPL